jgi:hypothetical protein
MRVTIGDTIRNKITQQEAQVVRIADTSRGMAYVVSIPMGGPWGDKTIETIWLESEVKKT